MKKLFFVALCCSFFATQAQTNAMASLKEVIEYFDDTYSFYSGSEKQLELSKNPKGWSVYEMAYKNKKWEKVNEQLFWDKATQKFLPLNYPTKTGSNPSLYYSASSWAYDFERNYYYGYDDAGKDVIRELGDKKTLGDTALEGLARAYSNYSRSFGENISRYGNNSAFPDTVTIPQNFADSFVKYVDKGIETFKRLYQQNPNYSTIVGSIYQKYCNEHMYAYITLCEWGHENKAQKYLAASLYEESFLSLAKNYLSSLEDNSIFISNGDNDTYPLLYLQLAKNYKKSVHIINNSLLYKPRYIQMIRKGYGGFLPLKMSILQSAYNSDATSYILAYKKEGEMHTTCAHLVNMVNTRYALGIPMAPLSIELISKQIALPVNKAACIANNLLQAQEEAPTQILATLAQYFYRNDLAVLDILYTNNWKNNIYTPFGYQTVNLNTYLRKAGLQNILHPVAGSTQNRIENDTKRLYANLTKNFKAEITNTAPKGSEYDLVVYNMRNAYVKFLDEYEGNDKAQIAEKGLNILPNNYLPYEFNCAQLAIYLAETQPQKAEEILILIANNLYSQYNNKKPLVNLYYDAYTEKETLIDELKMIKMLSSEYTFSKLNTTLDEINQKLNP